MPAVRVPKTYRLTPESIARIDRIAEARGGLTSTRVVELALEQLDKQVFGRRAPDMVPIKTTPKRAPKGR